MGDRKYLNFNNIFILKDMDNYAIKINSSIDKADIKEGIKEATLKSDFKKLEDYIVSNEYTFRINIGIRTTITLYQCGKVISKKTEVIDTPYDIEVNKEFFSDSQLVSSYERALENTNQLMSDNFIFKKIHHRLTMKCYNELKEKDMSKSIFDTIKDDIFKVV